MFHIDKLAKAARGINILQLNQTSNKTIQAVYTFNGKIVDIMVREFAKAQVKVKASKT